MIRTANVLVVALDNEGRVTLLNEAGEKITGYKQNEVLGKSWFELIVPKERYPHVWEEFGKLKAAGSIIDTLENPILTKSGEERIVSWKNSTLVLNGEVAGTLSFGTDITERKRAEKTLQESEEKFRLLTEKTNDLIWMTDINLVTIYTSPSAERLLGFRPEELLKLSPDSLMTPESFGRAQETLLKQLDLEREAGADPHRSVTLELEYCRKDGSTVWLENRISGIRDADGRLIGLHGVARDISERRKAEQALRDSEAIYKRLFENTQTAMEVVSGETGLVVPANESTARMFGFASPSDLIGVDSMKYLLPEDRDRVATQMAQALIDKNWQRGRPN